VNKAEVSEIAMLLY